MMMTLLVYLMTMPSYAHCILASASIAFDHSITVLMAGLYLILYLHNVPKEFSVGVMHVM
jgi:hypothetical protein